MKSVFTFYRGHSPVIVSVPHAGTRLPGELGERFTSAARCLPDTDWFVDRLYRWATKMGAGLITANYSRYVIDLNRPPDDAALYSRAGTGLLPQQTFAGQPIYKPSLSPDKIEFTRRQKKYWRPYHDQLLTELDVIRQCFGHAIVLDAHSIRSEVPLLFEGRLPDLNLGSFRGASADPSMIRTAMSALSASNDFSSVLDGRFQGGYITRHYGRPDKGIHALQLEMAQSVYMNEQTTEFDSMGAKKVLPVLQNLIDSLMHWSP